MSRVNRPNQFRPTLDRLEDREVPAAYWWSPLSSADLYSTTATNWL
jgi:hypothetical protein